MKNWLITYFFGRLLKKSIKQSGEYTGCLGSEYVDAAALKLNKLRGQTNFCLKI